MQEARIEEVKLQIKNLVIKAPFAGKITVIHKRPGQAVQSGDPIVTVARTDGPVVVAYVRENQGVRPSQGLPVKLRLRQPGGHEYNPQDHEHHAKDNQYDHDGLPA